MDCKSSMLSEEGIVVGDVDGDKDSLSSSMLCGEGMDVGDVISIRDDKSFETIFEKFTFETAY